MRHHGEEPELDNEVTVLHDEGERLTDPSRSTSHSDFETLSRFQEGVIAAALCRVLFPK